MAEPSIVIGDGLPTRAEQIQQVIGQTLERQDVLRLRFESSIYEGPPSRGYRNLRDAAWTVAIEHPTPEYVEQVLAVLAAAVETLQRLGPAVTLDRLQAEPALPHYEAAVVSDPTPA